MKTKKDVMIQIYWYQPEEKLEDKIIEKIPNKTQDAVIEGLDRIERRMGVVNF